MAVSRPLTGKTLNLGTLPGYYVDSVAGSDTNAGTADAPFKTFPRLLKLRLAPGEGIYLHCGSVWREALNLGVTQLVDGSTISSYGNSCSTTPPRITGSDDFSQGWTQGGNGVWWKSLPAGTPKIARLFVNGGAMRTAQWPNNSTLAKTSATSVPSRTGFTVSQQDIATLTGKDLSGAVIQATTQPWNVEASTVASFSAASGYLGLAVPTVFPEPAAGGYVLQDKLWMLDVAGEFFHNTATNTLYLMPPATVAQAGLNTALVEGAVRDAAVTLGQRKSLHISDLNIDMTRKDGFVINDAPNALVSAVVSSHHVRSGVRVFSAATLTGTDRNANIADSVFADNQIIGIDAINANRTTVNNSTISDTGMIASAGSALAGVWMGDGGVLTSSRVLHSAYVGIRFSGTDGTTISSNDVDEYCLRLADCGGIYTWNGPKGASKTVNQISTVAGNRLKSTITSQSPSTLAGIYLDDYSTGTTLRNNTVSGGQYGILIHNGSHHVIDSNKLWLSTKASLWASMDQTDTNAMTGNTIIGNQFVPLSAATGTFPALPQFQPSYAVQFWSSLDGLGSVSSGSNQFTGNQYVNVLSSSVPQIHMISAGIGRTYTPGEWRSVAKVDGILYTPASFALVNTNTAGELQSAGAFDNGLQGWTVWYAPPYIGQLNAMAPHSGCNGTCAEFTATSPNDSIWGQPFQLASGALYVAKMSVAFDSTATIVAPYISLPVAPFSTVYGNDGMSYLNGLEGAPGDSLQTETFFHASGNVSARISLKIKTPSAPVAFDNVSIKQVTGYSIGNPANWIAAVEAPMGSSLNVTCASLGWGSTCQAMTVDGTPVSLPETLNAGTSQLLMRADSPLRR